MKNSKTCPKCNGTEIYTNNGLAPRGDRCSIPITGWRSFVVSAYVCLRCGFVEEYMADGELNDAKLLDKLKSEWNRA
ncbi:MAG: hypothetical protein ACHQFW_07190 [Chitinophagales bacterium]